MINGGLPPVGTLNASDRSKEADNKKKEVNQVTKGVVKVDNGKLGKRLKEAIVSEDIRSVIHYLIFKKLIPDLKANFVEMVYDGLGMYLGTSSKKKSSSTREDYTIYSSPKYSYKGNETKEKKEDRDVNYQDIKFESKEDANEVLSNLQDLASQYDNQVSLADYYSLCGVTPKDFMYNKWGWTFDMLKRVNIRRSYGYWCLDLPDVVPIN